ncbi:hypothetical protein A1O3_00387 [Capronia epimyces CBS 606.96]|uniref:Uncharacterized protein n=1 Tax=Capronia epimyces CBS 606.96 TaxID=1182542 RepID=W9YG59_9EURO|nr:uncharacterized protein A1O3_00387 [Capronia epimyces CBS 606.96]EXJ91837.1 hypothetical protein A1O3_00387 [Capronia epimyces CBS 606.96]
MEALTENAQQGSPLFAMLPAEIRGYIFELCLTSQDDGSKPYRADRIFYRPGYHYYQAINCDLLRTCRRIYRETRLLPVSVHEHIFWLFNGPWKSIGRLNRNTARWAAWYRSLTKDQRNAVQVVHIFVQQCYLESLGTFADLDPLCFQTRKLHLTIRHSDWWSWESPAESNDRLGICPWRVARTSCQQMLAEPPRPSVSYIKERMSPQTWGGQICQVPGLQMLEMEFETDEVKRAQLELVVQRAKSWVFPLCNQNVVLAWTGQLKESSWEGLRELKDDYQVLREQPVGDNLPRRKYYVVSMLWRASAIA